MKKLKITAGSLGGDGDRRRPRYREKSILAHVTLRDYLLLLDLVFDDAMVCLQSHPYFSDAELMYYFQ